MQLNKLKPAKGATKSDKRIGRGQGSGRGGTSTRGHKGAKSRSGYSRKVGFEGGQQPIQRRLPKFGFKSPNRVEYKSVNIGLLQELASSKGISEFNQEVFVQNGLASKNELVKVLGSGELNDKINVTAHGFSASAKEAIEAKGGTATIA
ncbi:MAG: 50S ribosomal protein L15 [Flavobacteriales bacterium]|nr:50S ribosomal protein L15 [Flavobacteriales bacterium]MBO72777.1 50S ribosomal protein L15 [Flavobacteriales bacterium]|tara:strand:- start:1135 stop:1581 length:447 start_codon:yes stop_codon:yes gene_type:complete